MLWIVPFLRSVIGCSLFCPGTRPGDSACYLVSANTTTVVSATAIVNDHPLLWLTLRRRAGAQLRRRPLWI